MLGNTNPKYRLRGCHDTWAWQPLVRTTVTVPKGTLIFSSKPNSKPVVSKRNRKVVIDHFDRGMMVPAGYSESFRLETRHDEELLLEAYGTLEEEELRKYRIFQGYKSYLPVYDPRIVWVGAGRYWNYANINEVPEVLSAILKLVKLEV